MRSFKEIFEFLKPNVWNVGITVLLIAAVYVIWNYVLPGTIYLNALRVPADGLTSTGNQLLGRLLAAIMAGFIVVSYTLISIIVYFSRGEYKDEQ